MATVKKKPTRRCTGCGEHFEKQELVRIVRSPIGEISLDTTGKKPGRGAYICKNATCLRKAPKARRIEQNLGVPISDEIFAALEGEIST